MSYRNVAKNVSLKCRTSKSEGWKSRTKYYILSSRFIMIHQNKSAMDSINLLSEGLLEQFSALKNLEESLTQLLTKQNEQLNSYIMKLNFYTSDQEVTEISLMVNIYLRK